MPIDLHIHSTHSDGTLTPAEILAKAKRLGLSAVALTDHNTVSGLPDFLCTAKAMGITAVAGTELSTVHEGREIHLLGLFIPDEHFADITALMQDYRARKAQSNRDLVARLTAGGYALDYAEVERKNPNDNINRALIAKELMANGYVSSIKEAFDTLLVEGLGYYIPPDRLGFFDAIRFLRHIHSVPVWAHPLQHMDEPTVRAILPRAVEAGLAGMEVQHSSYNAETAARAKSIADEFGLLYSGGSDFHGTIKPDVKLGVGSREGDTPNIPDGYYDALLAYSQSL
jgi:predicted metal-dependent phosphoesterase TrpH